MQKKGKTFHSALSTRRRPLITTSRYSTNVEYNNKVEETVTEIAVCWDKYK